MMKCYFYGRSFEDRPSGRGIISLAVPDYGIVYRLQFVGSQLECEYGAALLLVRFIEANRRAFSGQPIQILTDSAEVVHQLRGESAIPARYKVYAEVVQMAMHKLSLKIAWLPRSENRAAQLAPELPPLRLKLELNLDFTDLHRRSDSTPPPDQLPF